MKKTILLLVIIGLSFLEISCASAIKETKKITEYQMISTNKDEIQMEFIGYKADTSLLSTTPETITEGRKSYTVMSPFDQWKSIADTTSLRQMGATLQQQNIATDQSFAYFGIYSLQELELYKARTRYITFIEVVKNKYEIKENGLNQQMWGALGALYLGTGLGCHIVGAMYPEKERDGIYERDYSGIKKLYNGLGVGMDIGGLIMLAVAAKKPKTFVTFDGMYNIYVYDTQAKEVIYKDAVTVSSKDTFDGSYLLFAESQSLVNDYYAKLICNAILKKYDSINQWLKMRN